MHQEIKTDSVFIGEDLTVKIGYLGIQKYFLPGQSTTDIAYTSPEGIIGDKDSRYISAKSDVWGAGCILYELLSGHKPFNGSEFELRHQILHKQPRRLNTISREMKHLIFQMLQKDPLLRPSLTQIIESEIMKKLNKQQPLEINLLKLSTIALFQAKVIADPSTFSFSYDRQGEPFSFEKSDIELIQVDEYEKETKVKQKYLFPSK